jgi:CzcA family heavy metal efflux pump
MLNHIIKFALGNRLVVLLASVLLLIGGSYTAVKMEVDVFPDLTAPTVAIITEAHGLAPEEVEQLVSFPIESTVNGSTDVRRVRSSASAGISIVWVEFDWGTDIYRARQIVAEKLATLSGKFPQGVSLPVLAPNTSIMGEIMLISITAKQTNLMELRSIADWNIRPVLLATGGVSQVVVIGGDYKQYQILAKPALLKAYGITVNELFKATNAIGQNVSGGLINQYGNEYLVKGILRSNKPEDIGNTLIKTINGKAVKIADVSKVAIGSAVKLGDGSLNAQPSVIMTVMKQPNTNTLKLTEKIDHTIEELKSSLPEDVVVNTKIFRQASFIEASIGNIEKTLIEGSIFVVIILSIFLMNWRATAISLIAIPISLLVAIVVLKLMGLTINTMSLGGMAIAIGDLVDDAIIDVENVLKRLKENAHLPVAQQENKFTVIYNASTEIRSSIIHATFIIIIAFTPLFFLTGMEGRLLVPLGMAFVVALFASLIVAITLTPVLCSYLLTSDKTLLKQEKESWLVRHLNHGYFGALQKAITYRKWLVTAVVGLFIGALVLFSSFGRSFLPEFNEGSLVISAVTMPGISLEESNKIGQQVERAMLSIPEVKTTTRRTGRAELDEHAQGVNASEIDVPFFLEERSRSKFMADVRQKLSGITGANITIGQPIGHRIDHMLSGTRANIAIKIFGQDLAELYRLGNETKKAIADIPGLVDISVEQQIQIPQIQIKPKRDLLAAKGISLEDFSRFVEVSIGGEKVGDVYEAGKRFDLVLRYEESARSKIEDLKNLLIDAGDGSKVALGSVAEIVSTKGPNTINRENAQRKLVVSANVAGRDQLSAVEEIQAKMKSIQLPQNYRVEYGGQFEAEAEASRTLMLTSVFALLAIFLVLYHEFKDSALAMIILINLPLALIGGIVSVWLTGSIISIPIIIGFITLFGIATRNGILLVSHYRHLQQEKGFYDLDIVIKGSIDRLSPILMTALTAGLALIPLAMASDQPGNEIQSPMANVILGGLLSSTLLNLFIVPIVYNSLMKKRQSINLNQA